MGLACAVAASVVVARQVVDLLEEAAEASHLGDQAGDIGASGSNEGGVGLDQCVVA